eukprot:CAMPEP_0174351370 /NCGR_PEP_ID=MMETSP0811_2-20130205/8726_1 /TAXON_ID=73025 ORGANISM="Eutreptiella gymnastica-like, Strain CCMP1594" /NCGR_SAMPLE_ID=MMETSP0811_2 /ASSEMBLY_ACC=CAM_ASM_000667 /LENGTH=74 /DNA_ID=CAMNT_0015480535 /DNA_START=397 /DNA_END=622 /DNA_ORIENTATION=+
MSVWHAPAAFGIPCKRKKRIQWQLSRGALQGFDPYNGLHVPMDNSVVVQAPIDAQVVWTVPKRAEQSTEVRVGA